MLSFLLNAGIANVTLWVALVASAAALVAALRRRPASLPRLLTWRPVLALVAGGVVLNLAAGVYRGYVAPRDLMQDVVSAQQFLRGETLYPDHMNDLMRRALAADPPHSLLESVPALRQKEIDSLETTLSQHWVQAHPPLMTLCFVPLVAFLGVGGTYAATVVLSLASLAATLGLARRGLGVTLEPRHALLLVLVLLGWDNVIALLRSGQIGLVLGALMAAGWYLLRGERPWLAGVPIGIAAALKAFPALLLFYLLLRHRRAFLSAALTLGLLTLLCGSVVGWDAYREHFATSRGVVPEYATYPGNISLMALIARLEAPHGAVHTLTPLIYYGTGFAILTAVALFVRRNPRAEAGARTFLDLEYALLMTLMVLLSPVAWDHYVPVALLPLLLLGRSVLADAATKPRSVALFAGLVAVLAVPDTAFTTFLGDLTPGPLQVAARVALLPLRTYVLAVVCFWLVRRAVRTPAEPPVEETPAPARRPLKLPAFSNPHLLGLAGVLLAVLLAHLAVATPSEPFFNGDETRHVATGVFFRDLLHDRPFGDLQAYAERYYLQYPALGLLVWPPLFHAVEGAAMCVGGTSFAVARATVAAFALLALVYVFRLARRTHGTTTAMIATLLFGLSPLVFEFSRRVMLEVPTLALAIVALFHATRYIAAERRRDLIVMVLATAAAALTRYDAIFLAPLFLILVVGCGRRALLRRPAVWSATAAAVLLVAPVYVLAAREIGRAHLVAIAEGTEAKSSSFLAAGNFVYYPACVPEQVGWGVAVPAAVGLLLALRRDRRAQSWPYLALALATYLTFTPMAELAPRHAIYWTPAVAVFAADALLALGTLRPRLRLVPGAVVVAATALVALRSPMHTVRGYEAAARYAIANSGESSFCLFDGLLNGNFIYQVRRHDPERRLWVLRGDKLLYGVLSNPEAAYAEWAPDDAAMLALIDRYGPALVVVEEPQLYIGTPAAERLRALLKNHPDRFALETVFPVESNWKPFRRAELHVYRNRDAGSDGAASVEMKMLGLGRSLRAER